MRLDVVVPCWNQHDLTLDLVRSFWEHAPEWTRLILVDNGSSPPLSDHVVLDRGLLIRSEDNLGFVKATNLGTRLSDADYVCWQNNDTEVYAGCYERLVADLEANPDVALIAPVSSECGTWLSVDVLRKRWPWFARELPEGHAERAAYLLGATFPPELRGRIHRPSMVPFYCAVLRRATLDRFGLLSEEFGMGLGDDDDYCRRVQAGGMECGLSLGTYVRHVGRATFRAEYTPEELRAREGKAAELVHAKWGGA